MTLGEEFLPRDPSPVSRSSLTCGCSFQLADLNKRLPPESCLAAAKAPCRARPPALRPAAPHMPHTITLQPSSLRNLRLPKRLRVIYFFARTRLAQRLIMVRAGWHHPPQPCPGSHTQPGAAPWDPDFQGWLSLEVILQAEVTVCSLHVRAKGG